MEGLAGTLIGSYRLSRHLGSGGYGEVFLAQAAGVTTTTGAHGSHVVLKAFPADAAGSVISALAQARQIAAHPNTLFPLDAGVDGAAAFIAMPYIPSGSIESLLIARPNTPDQWGVAAALVAPIVAQVSAALQTAHDAGIVHGDLKPGNIFLSSRPGQAPLALVGDFGQSALVDATLARRYPISPNAHRAPAEVAMEFAAPEQLEGRLIPASDQFALAAIACLLLTGKYPVQRGAAEWSSNLLADACASRLPGGVTPVLRRALSTDPANRYADITTFAQALDAGLADAKGISLATPHHAPAPTPLKARPAVSAPASAPAPLAATVSYAPTGVALIDGILERVEQITHGKAGLLQRAFTYVFIGGIAALINLAVLYLTYNVMSMPFTSNVHWLIAFIVAAEVSTMSNFVLNDRITFSHLPGHARSWWARCLRFHSTSAAGTIATLIMSFAFKTWLGMSALLAEAVAIMLALILNFTMHHVWTYRHVKEDGAHSASAAESLLAQEAQGRAS